LLENSVDEGRLSKYSLRNKMPTGVAASAPLGIWFWLELEGLACGEKTYRRLRFAPPAGLRQGTRCAGLSALLSTL